jgi:3-methylcrotonyl-CoA carboxylase beta subunit
VRTAALRARGQEPDGERLEALRAEVTGMFEEQSSSYFATARLWDDGIIDPRETRRVLGLGISMSCNRDFVSDGSPRYGVFRM